jgi:hypothetical protein
MSNPDSPRRPFRPTRGEQVVISDGVARISCHCGQFLLNTNALVPGAWFDANCPKHGKVLVYLPSILPDDPQEMDEAA